MNRIIPLATAVASLACLDQAWSQAMSKPPVHNPSQNPANAAVTAGGPRVSGELRQGDRRLGDNSFYRCHRLEARQGQTVTITQRSSAFDSYMVVGHGADCGSMTSEASDDDSGGGLDSQVTVTVGPGQWWIRANTLRAEQTGAYTLEATAAGATASTPSSGQASAQGGDEIRLGQTIEGRLAFVHPTLDDGTHYRCFGYTASGETPTQIDLSSSAFDSYLIVRSGSCESGQTIEENDDGPNGLNSRIVRTLPAGRYALVVNTVNAGETGDFTLSVASASNAASTAGTGSAFGGVSATTLAANYPTRLPRITEVEWEASEMNCTAAYQAAVDMRAEDVLPGRFGNVLDIDYGPRAASTRRAIASSSDSHVRELAEMARAGGSSIDALIDISLPIYAENFQSMALIGSLGTAPNGTANQGRPLAVYLDLLGRCDRAFGHSPATTY